MARKHLISVEDTPLYHCVMRCVRRSYLCGVDKVSGKNYDHRKQWAVTRLRQLASVFAIDICAYAIMSNHYHVILHINKSKALAWSEREVVDRWMQIFRGDELIDSWLAGEELSLTSKDKVTETIKKWRNRLMDISWFMRCMNETMARQANAEDECKGRFWEGRFKSQALLDEASLLACMAYVDLNPVRAGASALPEESDFTSIQARLFEVSKQRNPHTKAHKKMEQRMRKQEKLLDRMKDKLPQGSILQAPLMPFSRKGQSASIQDAVLPFEQEDYFELLDATGRLLKKGKRGFIAAEAPPILERLGMDESQWAHTLQRFGAFFAYSIGSKEKLRRWSQKSERAWCKGVSKDLSAHETDSFAA